MLAHIKIMQEDNDIEISEDDLKKTKLQLEINELKKPWFRKPSFLVPIIGTISTLVMLYITGFFDVKFAELRIQRENLIDENKELQEEKDLLELNKQQLLTSTRELEAKQEVLKKNEKILESSKENLLIEEQTLISKNKILNARRIKLQSLEKELIERNDSIRIAGIRIQKQFEKANQPILSFTFEDNPTNQICEVVVTNSGLGPAYFKTVSYYIDGKEVIIRHILDVMKRLDINQFYHYGYYIAPYPNIEDKDKRIALAAGKKLTLFRIEKEHFTYENRNHFKNAINRLGIKVEYCNISEICKMVEFH
ncbi:hypothetical protein FGF1_08930 [Flavobacteriaceae bacterium GF1]